MPNDAAATGLQAVRDFFHSSRLRSGEVYMGIDPGASGAIALVQQGLGAAFNIPTYAVARAGKTRAGKKRTKTVFDDAAIIEIFDEIDSELGAMECTLSVCVEEAQVRVTRGGRAGAEKGEHGGVTYTAFRVGYGFGMWPLFLKDRGYRVLTIHPISWKKKAGLIGKDKEHSRQRAAALWPHVPLTRKADADLAEALLLAATFQNMEVSGMSLAEEEPVDE